MRHSDSIVEITKAMSQAQGEFKNAVCNKTNAYYNSNYADLGTILDIARPILSRNGLAIIQSPSTILEEKKVKISTMLVHTSGEYFSDELDLPGDAAGKDGNMKFNVQTIGIAITYGRRYAVSPFLGIAAEEDTDGNSGAGNDGAKKDKLPKNIIAPPPKKPKVDTDALFHRCQDGEVALKKEGIVDEATFSKDMKELENIKDDAGMLEHFLKATIAQYNRGKEKKPAEQKEIF